MDTGQPLGGQVAVITGAGRGIGAAISRKLAALGATAVLLGAQNPLWTRPPEPSSMLAARPRSFPVMSPCCISWNMPLLASRAPSGASTYW